MRKNGYTLIEILVVIAISLILAGAIFTLYTTIIKENMSKSLIAKKESDAKIMIYQLLKDLEGIGFGVDNSRLKINGENSPFLTITDNGQKIIFLNISARDEQYSGCWGYGDITGNLNISLSKNYLSRDCPSLNNKFLFLDSNKNCKFIETYQNPNIKYANLVAFYVGDIEDKSCPNNVRDIKDFGDIEDKSYPNNVRDIKDFGDIEDKSYPSAFKVEYSLKLDDISKKCMIEESPLLYTLYRQVGKDTPQPVASCIHTLKFRYGKTDGSYADSVNSINDLSSVVVCMLIQVGGKQSTQEPVPSFKTNRCNNITINETTNMRYYRWTTIEEEVILKNIR